MDDILIENLNFVNSPYWTVHLENINSLIVRYVKVINTITKDFKHSYRDLTAFNTDGIDVTGNDVNIFLIFIFGHKMIV